MSEVMPPQAQAFPPDPHTLPAEMRDRKLYPLESIRPRVQRKPLSIATEASSLVRHKRTIDHHPPGSVASTG